MTQRLDPEAEAREVDWRAYADKQCFARYQAPVPEALRAGFGWGRHLLG